MNDMRKLFAEHEKTAGPPLGLDTDELARKGRNRLAARRVSAVGGLGAAVAVIAVAAVTLTSLSSPAPADQAADGSAEQPEYPLPELPGPPENYDWGVADEDDMEPSKAADAYGDAFTGWFASNGIGIDSWPGMAVKHRPMFSLEAGESDNVPGDFPPYYGPRSTHDNAYLDSRKDESESVGLKVHPRASFKQGAGDTYEYLYKCKDENGIPGLPETDRTCAEQTGPDGEEYVTVKTTITDNDRTRQKENRVVVFREDGTAVEVFSWVNGRDLSDGTKPKLSFDELTDLALSMPDEIVKD